MHPLVRDIYKRAILVGRDYPHPDGLDYVRRTWKAALRDPSNCPSCYADNDGAVVARNLRGDNNADQCEKEIRRAVGRGRHIVREMIGVIQLKKYRTMRRRYGEGSGGEGEEGRIRDAVEALSAKASKTTGVTK